MDPVVKKALRTLYDMSIDLANEYSGNTAIQMEEDAKQAYHVLKKALKEES